MRARLTLAAGTAAAALAGSVFAASPALAGPGDTPVTFTIAAGTLAISSPQSTVTLAPSGALSVNGTSVSAQLGTTTVSDARGTAVHSVTVNMTSTEFAHGAGGAAIPATAATGFSGVATGTGTGVPVSTLAAPANSNLSAGTSILTVGSVLGAGGATYSPTVSVAVPASAMAGTYTGTVTQTVT